MNAATMANSQRGLTFTNFLLGAIVVVFVAILILKVLPAYIQNRTIQHALDEIAHKPEMQDATVNEIQNTFDKYAQVDNINAVTSQDLLIDKSTGHPILRVKYQAKVPLVANVSLVFDFDNTSTRAR